MSLIANAGPFGLLIVVLGTLGLCACVAQLATGREARGFVMGTALLALLVGVIGTGLGLLRVADAVRAVEDAQQAAHMWRQGFAVASSTTTLGAMAALVDFLGFSAVKAFRRGARR